MGAEAVGGFIKGDDRSDDFLTGFGSKFCVKDDRCWLKYRKIKMEYGSGRSLSSVRDQINIIRKMKWVELNRRKVKKKVRKLT
jgi:hypothetical protein